jgi:hypothetical protein
MSEISFSEDEFHRIFGISIEDIKEHYPVIRNTVLEEVAKEFDKMPFGDTASSFATFVRNMKQ